MAQVIAEKSVGGLGLDGVEIRSAGTLALPGDGASEGARAAAESRGLTLEEHESTPLDTELVAWADLILTMGPHHADAAEAFGGRGKVWMVSAFSEGGEHTRGTGVPDPFGGDARAYRECFEVLERLVKAALLRVEAEFLATRTEDDAP